MKKNSIFLALGLATAAFQGPIMGAEVSTEPVGVMNVSVKAGTDTTLSAPLRRAVEFQGSVASISGNVVTLNASLVGSQFQYHVSSQPKYYYLQVKSTASPTSAVTGAWFQVVTNSAGTGTPATSTITLDPGGAQTVQQRGLAAGDVVQVIPYWTLATIFPQGKGIVVTSNLDDVKDTVFFMAQDNAGANLQASQVNFYNTSSDLPQGWYNLGTYVKADNDPIPPDSYIVIRNTGGNRTVTLTGGVLTTKMSTVIGIVAANTPQDNFVVNPFPVAISLAESKLLESGAFRVTSNLDDPQDLVLSFDGTETGMNIQPSKTYFYCTDPQLGTGWYNIGTYEGPLDNSKLLKPGMGFIVRKVPGPVQSHVWTLTPPY